MLTQRQDSANGSARPRGQALLMVTVALLAMFGLLGLAVDLGWEFYVHKTARAAADSAALAAVRTARAAVVGNIGPYTCMTQGFTCQPTPVRCTSATGSLAVGCQFATTNAFPDGGLDGRQTVTISANVGPPGCGTLSPPNCVPTAPGVSAAYWVHVVATETVPQLFSGIFGNTLGTVSAESTAALLPVIVPGSIILLNRQYDNSPAGAGVDLKAQGSATITAPAGILLASNTGVVGRTGGSSNVDAKFTYIRGSGTADWRYTNGLPDSAFFQDPESGKGQPPMDAAQASKPMIPVPNGILSTTQCPNNICPSGNYYATTTDSQGRTSANGTPILVDGNFTFDGGPFGAFLFFGGVQFKNGTATLGPGRYVLAGVQGNNPILDIGNGAVAGGTGNDAGRIFVLTDSSYGGSASMAAVVAAVPNKTWTALGFGEAFLQSGNGQFSLYGLNSASPSLPAELQNFSPVVMWQDQRNSTVLYDANGYVRNSPDCGGDGADRACPSPLQVVPKLTIKGGNQSTTTTIAGVVYQPRGATTIIDASTNYIGSLALITGSIDMHGSPSLNLSGQGLPITTLTSALVH